MGFVFCRFFHHLIWYSSLIVRDLDGTRGTYGKCICGREYFSAEETKIVVPIGNKEHETKIQWSS